MSADKKIQLDISNFNFDAQYFTENQMLRDELYRQANFKLNNHGDLDSEKQAFDGLLGNGNAMGRGDRQSASDDSKDAPAQPGNLEALLDRIIPTHLSLFGTINELTTKAGDALQTQADPVMTELVNVINTGLQRLMVSDGSSGNRQVRMMLKEDVLPGVSVVIHEVAGRLQVDYVCSQEASRLRLNDAAPEQARVLAASLNREVLVTVQTDDEEDLCLLEALASP